MFTLKFLKSRSKNYKLVLSLAQRFNQFNTEQDLNIIDFSIKEVFEKWDFFNLMFWKTVDWKDQTFGFDGFDLHAHPEKTRIFYALQDAYIHWTCMSEKYIKSIAPAYYNGELIPDLKQTAYSEASMDFLLDRILIAKYRGLFEREYGNLPKEIHFRISDFGRKRAVLKAMEEEEERKKKLEGF